jgi:hypothetical protein
VAWHLVLGGCTLDEGALESRRAEWEALDVHRCAASAVPGGFTVTYRDEAGVAAALDRLVEAEGGCCGFATWQVGRRDGCLVLTVTGPDPGIAELRQAFDVPG